METVKTQWFDYLSIITWYIFHFLIHIYYFSAMKNEIHDFQLCNTWLLVIYDFIMKNKVLKSTSSLVLIAIGGIWLNILSLNSLQNWYTLSIMVLLSSSLRTFEPILIFFFNPLTIEENRHSYQNHKCRYKNNNIKFIYK